MSGVSRAKFPKSAHLLKHADFRRVYEQGRRHFSEHLTAFYLRRGEDGAPGQVRIGFTVGRALGGSVERNRIRRRTREAVRFHLAQLTGVSEPVDIVLNPKKSVLKVDFAVLSEEVLKALQVIRKNLERRANIPPKPKEGLNGAPKAESLT